MPFESPYGWIKRVDRLPYKNYRDTVSRLRKRGVVKVTKSGGRKFLELTKSGVLEVLLQKAGTNKASKWDGKWRLIIFDIPEAAKQGRDQLRFLLKRNNFRKLQASVFISPYSLNPDCIAYLKEKKLMNYIRILRVDKIDDETELKKQF